MKFDINKYRGNYCMHCKTEEEAIIFTQYLDSIGKTWCSGSRYTKDNLQYHNYGSRTCYEFGTGEYCHTTWFLNHDYIVLEFEDFEWEGYVGNNFEVFDENTNLINSFLSGFSVVGCIS